MSTYKLPPATPREPVKLHCATCGSLLPDHFRIGSRVRGIRVDEAGRPVAVGEHFFVCEQCASQGR